jgi:cardiolipin synthase
MHLEPRHLPNIISVARILLVYPVVSTLLEQNFTSALLWFTIAGLSDGIDGFLARHFGWQSRLGSYLDPIADKLLLVFSYVCLAHLDRIPDWLAALVVARDLIILGGATVYYFLFEPFEGQPSIVSKINTFLQLLLVFLILVAPLLPFETQTLQTGLIGLVAFTTAFSGVQYVAAWGRRYLQRRNPTSVD